MDEVTEVSSVGGTWTAVPQNIPGSVPVTDKNTPGEELTQETLVENTGVTGVKFYVGSDAYKILDNMPLPDGMVGASKNSQWTNESGVKSRINDDHPVPDSGTYFKWVPEVDGTLEIVAINNGKDGGVDPNNTVTTYVTVDGRILEEYKKARSAKTQETIMVTLRKGQVLILGVGGMNASKPQLCSFRFSEGTLVDITKKITADRDAKEMHLTSRGPEVDGLPLFVGENFTKISVITQDEYDSRLRLGSIEETTLYITY